MLTNTVHTQSEKDWNQHQGSKHRDLKSTQQENCSPLKATNALYTYKIHTWPWDKRAVNGIPFSGTLKILLLSSILPSRFLFLFRTVILCKTAVYCCLISGYERKGRLAQTKEGTAYGSYFRGNMAWGTTVLSMGVFPPVSCKTRRRLTVSLPFSGTKSKAESNSWVDTSRMGSSFSPGFTQTTWKPVQSLTWNVRLPLLLPPHVFLPLSLVSYICTIVAMVPFAHCDPLSWLQFTNRIYDITTSSATQVWIGTWPLYIHCACRGWDTPPTNLQWSTLKRLKFSVATAHHGSASMFQALEYGHYMAFSAVTTIAKQKVCS